MILLEYYWVYLSNAIKYDMQCVSTFGAERPLVMTQ